MDTDLLTLYDSYQRYIRHPQSERVDHNVRRQRADRPRMWGEPLTIEEFALRWKRICADPGLERLWIERLSAGPEQAIREMGKVVERLAQAGTIKGEKAA